MQAKKLMPIQNPFLKNEQIEEVKQEIETIQEQDFEYMPAGTGDEVIEEYKDCLEEKDLDDLYSGLQDCLSNHQAVVEDNTYVDYIN